MLCVFGLKIYSIAWEVSSISKCFFGDLMFFCKIKLGIIIKDSERLKKNGYDKIFNIVNFFLSSGKDYWNTNVKINYKILIINAPNKK